MKLAKMIEAIAATTKLQAESTAEKLGLIRAFAAGDVDRINGAVDTAIAGINAAHDGFVSAMGEIAKLVFEEGEKHKNRIEGTLNDLRGTLNQHLGERAAAVDAIRIEVLAGDPMNGVEDEVQVASEPGTSSILDDADDHGAAALAAKLAPIGEAA